MAVSPFSSWRNVRRGQALGGERIAERNKGKAENRSMQFVKCGQAGQGKKTSMRVYIYENVRQGKEGKQ